MPTIHAIRKILDGKQLINELAAIEHERWADWQRHVHSQCERQQDGSLVIPPALVARWEGQIETPYDQLSDKEKDSDREQVRRYLPVIINHLVRGWQ